tara:strand:+ start:1219 stop:1692 length:474 start_codon:yes stop_codon:yes gene_type:complete
MKLHEIYEGYVRFKSVREIANKILSIDNEIKHDGKCGEDDYKWLQLKSEDEGLLSALGREANRYTNQNQLDYGGGSMLDTASELARATLILADMKQKLDDDSKTQIQQATDEVINSAEMRELVRQQAFVDLQNSYAQAETVSAKRVGALANLASDLI